ncbi:cob(I)yrinic acid a,c-diamide adenosyltransferase [Sansalvadorimonas sp. 2012CJ34-2]|uniref:Corrinoid adenosyltransferase n=1 Tax=Parendozoicomonas callyspongiae TaxID=2942213 RepID=A0ABT0PKL1_9GAMM|nr:cob(I)yrinic acid a,c-diamide adenosyltransferase [Sansalvadorimonas sp. 2012CJ34-2]MCL6271786.1 cob(I)yrinic acid a,c-diamide adenosyltransferase [Sansalvadorimonas sp. 2012CJ34-2]
MTSSSTDDKYKQRMQRKKEHIDKKIAEANEERGIIILITGNGKGKSTSGFGTVLRCVGHGLKAGVAQFIKGKWDCGERNILEKLGVDFHVMGTGFTWDTQNKELDTQAAQEVWQETRKMLSNPELTLVLLDELTYIARYGYIDTDEIIEALNNRPKMQSVIITGRGCPQPLTDIADTISEIKDVRHAYNSGVKAQKGIDW